MPKRRLERNINLEADLVVVVVVAAVDDDDPLQRRQRVFC